MIHSRIIQLIAIVMIIASMAAAGNLLPRIMQQSQEATLRYTDVAVDNAPPEVAIGQAIGALRGILVDVLWIRANIMKEEGLYYEANTLADLITRLQPRFASVWAFHSHNMAYNISVATHTQEERWEWVKKGLDLMRTRALVYNPNNVELYKDLAYYFMHKVEGVSDDAHLYYKRMICDEWHKLLGPPPTGYEQRIAWIKEIADAPLSIEAAEKRTPGVAALVEDLRSSLRDLQDIHGLDMTGDFLNRDFLNAYSRWLTIQTSPYSRVLGSDQGLRAVAADPNHPDNQVGRFYVAMDTLARDPERAEAWTALLAFTRKKVLHEDYNMDAQFMYELTRDWGPIDWRHGCAHTLYWSRMGAKRAEKRSNNDDLVYKIVNNDRMAAAAMQDLARFGWIIYDPASLERPSRMPDTRWIPGIDRFFEHLYLKHQNVSGWGPDNFLAWYENYMRSAVRELYRMGDKETARQIYERLDARFGRGHLVPNPKYAKPLDVFVDEITKGEYELQPHVATTDVQNALYYAIRFGLGRGKPELYEEAKKFADDVLTYFKTAENNKFVNKFGEERIAGIIGELESVELAVFARIMLDPDVPLQERLSIYANHTPLPIQQALYDMIKEPLQAQVNLSPLGDRIDVAQMEPPGMAAFRARQEEVRRQQQQNQVGGRATMD